MMLFQSLVLCASFLVTVHAGPTWVTLPMNVPQRLSDLVLNSATVPTLVGTPPQLVNATLDLNTAKLAMYSRDCMLCSGNTSFDASLSTTFKALNYSWPYSTSAYFGNMSSDTIGFGGLISTMQTEFGLIETGGDQTLAYLLYNGRLGILPDPLNATAASSHFLTRMYASGQLLNPVVGMRFDPANPKMTIGALDPHDYQGDINWVPLISPPSDGSWKFENIFGIDGLKGYNGSFLPGSENALATMDSVFVGVSMPNVNTYLKDTNYSGPVTYKITSDGLISYACNGNLNPYVALTATINGVDYPIDSDGNLLRTLSPMVPRGYCSVGIANKTSSPPHMLNLGLPFLRSVYMAFRFPTDNCPGYYGFAFPSGSINRTASQISQTPSSTPTNSAQCLAFSTPTSAPLLSLATGTPWSKGYEVYGDPGQAPVDLFGAEGLPRILWNETRWT